jgi:hypothetical protein
MFRMWKLERTRARIDKDYEEKRAALNKKQGVPNYEFGELEFDHYERRKGIDGAIEYALSQRLLDEARDLDVPKPPSTDKEMWDREEEDGEVLLWLNAIGRAHLRKLIAEEKTRRFEVKTLWVTKLIIPLASLLIGVIGALIGLFAVLHHNVSP